MSEIDTVGTLRVEDLCIVVASNNEASLHRNLLVSDLVTRQGVLVHVERASPSASVAYNRGLDATQAPIVIFAHQDVYFPPAWFSNLAVAITQLEQLDPDWALIAPYGVSLAWQGIGDLWTTSLSARIGQKFSLPVPAQSFDELTIILRRGQNLRFDERLPFFHLYGTDIVQTARAEGLGAYVVNLPLVHNDGFHARLGKDFTSGYHYLRRKWRGQLPLCTPVVKIGRYGLSLPVYRLRALRSIEKRRAVAGDIFTDPRVFSERCGWETN